MVVRPQKKRLERLAATLDTHRGFAEVLASLKAGHGGTVGGTWGSACALVTAARAGELPAGGRLVVVLPHSDSCETFLEDLSLFHEDAGLHLPALESFDDDSSADPAYAQRLAVVKSLAAGARDEYSGVADTPSGSS
ncbi:MAG: hypothetical protein ACKOCN_12130 [Planctomycetaceae bacterium]